MWRGIRKIIRLESEICLQLEKTCIMIMWTPVVFGKLLEYEISATGSLRYYELKQPKQWLDEKFFNYLSKRKLAKVQNSSQMWNM
jgi:hypothetical protein